MRYADRQSAKGQRLSRRHQLAKYRLSASAVQDLARDEITLRYCRRVAPKPARRAGRFTARHYARNRHSDLEADQVVGLVHRAIPTGDVSLQSILGEAASDIF